MRCRRSRAAASATVTASAFGSRFRCRTLVNVSASDITVRVNGVAVGSVLAYAEGTGCFTVNSTESGLSVEFPAQTVAFGSANGLDFLPGETANVFATNFDSTEYRLYRVPVETTSPAGLARLLVFNASGAGTYDAYVTDIGRW